MGSTKKYFYKQKQIDMAALSKVLGHPARMSIVELIAKHDHLACKDIGAIIPLAQSSISRHMNVLFESGILGYEVIGSQSFYRVNSLVLEKFIDYIQHIQMQVNAKELMLTRVYFKADKRIT